MKSLPRKIIKGAEVEGIMFCNPNGGLESEKSSKLKEEEGVKALEVFWYKKGFKEGFEQGFEEGQEKGNKESHQKGFAEGEKVGFEKGLSKGKDEGIETSREEAQEEFSDIIKLLNISTREIQEEKKLMIEQAKPDIIELCTTICEKILPPQISQPKDLVFLIENLLQKAKSITHNEVTQIFLSSEDFDSLSSHFEKIHFDKHDIKKLDFASDPSLTKGSCRIETSRGLVNFDISRQLKDLQEELRGCR